VTALFSLWETVIFWVILIAVYVTIGVVVRREYGGDVRKAKGKRRKELSPFLNFAALAVTILIGYARIGVLPHWLFYPGEILFVAGYAFTIYSIVLLGRYYSTYVEVLPDHKVIERGPYRLIRHPNYLGQLVGSIGLGLALQSWVALLVLVITGVGYFAYRMRNEEAFLIAEMGDNYANYMTRTKRLIPFVF
jgi:protein-S-isoprenylcysteine O-methyltransferase Ste14